MNIHPQLWPIILGIAIGLPLVLYAALWYARRFPRLSLARRWGFGLVIAVFELAFWLGAYAGLIEPRLLVVREVEIVSEHWTGAPLRMALIGDTHVGGPHVSAARVESIVARVNAERPDIVFLLGDYITGHSGPDHRTNAENAEIERGLIAFARLDAPLGVVAVIGNHDVWYDRDDVIDILEHAGVAVLWNRSLVQPREGGDILIVGLEDETTGDPDFDEAMGAAPALDAIVLSHSPDPFPDMPESVALMVAAHTHCGQVSVPVAGRPVIPSHYGQRYACGRIDEGGRTLYVTGGIGTSLLPFRFLNPPEIVIATLRGAEPGPIAAPTQSAR